VSAGVRAGTPPLAAREERSAGLIEALDGRTRLLGAFGLVLTIALLKDFPAKIAALVMALALVSAAGLSFAAIGRKLLHVEGFMIALLLLLPFTAPGEPIAHLGPLVVSDRGVERAISLVITVNASVLTVLALLTMMEPVRLGRSMAALGMPPRFVHLFLFLVRYLPILRDELTRQVEAMRARGFSMGLKRHTWRSLGNLVGMLLVRSIERAERVDEAMRCRGFSGRFPLRAMRPMGMADLRFAMLCAGALVCLVLLEFLL